MSQPPASDNLPCPSLEAPDDIRVARWFLFYALLLATCVVALVLLVRGMHADWSAWHDAAAQWRQHWRHSFTSWKQLWAAFLQVFAASPATFKLLFLFAYLTLCTTLLPLPTGPLVAAMATQAAAVGGGLGSTTLLVATVGALGSTVGNLNDYHLFTLMLRSRKVARIRNTRAYHVAAKWFDRGPFFIQTMFNLLPIPVDIARLLAITCRYDRFYFAAASFLGRFCRYAVFASVTYYFELGSIAPLVLLGAAVLMAAGKGIASLAKK